MIGHNEHPAKLLSQCAYDRDRKDNKGLIGRMKHSAWQRRYWDHKTTERSPSDRSDTVTRDMLQVHSYLVTGSIMKGFWVLRSALKDRPVQ